MRCNFTQTAFKGTWFHNTRIGLGKNLVLVYLYLSGTFNLKFAEQELEISQTTIIDYLSFIRATLVNWVIENGDKKIGGKNCIVEIDESKFGSSKYGWGKYK